MTDDNKSKKVFDAGAYFNALQNKKRQINSSKQDQSAEEASSKFSREDEIGPIISIRPEDPTWQSQWPWNEIKDREKGRKRTLSKTVRCDQSAHKTVWKWNIGEIIRRYNLHGVPIQYEPMEDEITEDRIHRMLRKTMALCKKIDFAEDGIPNSVPNDPFNGPDNFVDRVIFYLRDGRPAEITSNNGQKIDLSEIFRLFLIECYESKTLPEFLELLRRHPGVKNKPDERPTEEDSKNPRAEPTDEDLGKEIRKIFNAFKNFRRKAGKTINAKEFIQELKEYNRQYVTDDHIRQTNLQYTSKNLHRFEHNLLQIIKKS